MDLEYIENILKHKYDIQAIKIEKIKNVYKIVCIEEVYCLKVINYRYKHFNFILSAILHLQKNGFNKIPEIIATNEGDKYIFFNNKYAYLTKWILGRESNYDNPLELESVTKKLAELHIASEGFNIENNMEPRIGWFSWINTFNTRKNEILDFKNRINQKAYKDEFDYIYLENINEEIRRAEKAIEELKKSNYLRCMDKEIYKRGFCHHDYANHNILINNFGELIIIDFDYCILDTFVHDLSSLIIRTMKNGRWNIKKGEKIINAYSKVKKIDECYFKIINEFIRFPQDFWQIGIQRYWEQQPWRDELFLNKISKYLIDRKDREEFISNFLGGDKNK